MGIPHDLEGDGKCLKKEMSAFWRNGDLMCGRTRLGQMISTIHDAATVNKGKKDRKTNMEIKKPYTDVQYNKFIKDVEGRPVPQLLLSSEEN